MVSRFWAAALVFATAFAAYQEDSFTLDKSTAIIESILENAKAGMTSLSALVPLDILMKLFSRLH
jgi:hypothetical protein